MTIRRGYIVVHDYPISDERTDHGIAGGPYDLESQERVITALEAAQNQLAYCEAMQEAERPGSDGRYYIAEYREIPGGDPR